MPTNNTSIEIHLCVATILFSSALTIAFFYKFIAFVYVVVITLFGITYSLPPLKFNGRTYFSQLYWILLCVCCYILLIAYFENVTLNFITTSFENGEVNWMLLTHNGDLIFSVPAFVYFSGILIFMGIAEILAKDLRDMKNDLAGGRHTFVNKIGVRIATQLILPIASLGLALWITALFMSFSVENPMLWLCVTASLVWLWFVFRWCNALKGEYVQPLAAKLHIWWTNVYLLLQILTFLGFFVNGQ